MIIDPSFLKQISTIGIGFAAAFLAALWLSLIFWTFRDIRTRSRDPFMRILSVIIVALLSLPGVLIYLILRPPRTLDDDYQHSLEEEALLQSLEDAALCPGCSRHIQRDWVACPNCHVKLKKSCSHCGKAIEIPWNLCPYCGTPVSGTELTDIDDFIQSPSLGDEEENPL
jgi:RNA polymerase subunit RPABC4/transcription elongation factor Spt4